MLLVSPQDLKLYWEGKGLLTVYARSGMIPKREADLAAAWECPDRNLRRRLLDCNRKRRKKACARGEHIRAYGDDCCLFCKAPMEPIPDYPGLWSSHSADASPADKPQETS